MDSPSNMVYCERGGVLFGIISTGDIWRACRKQQTEVAINREFMSLRYGEYMKAKTIFEENESINALPVVTNGNILIGDYTRWDDLLILEYLINVVCGQTDDIWEDRKRVALVCPGRILQTDSVLLNCLESIWRHKL